MCVCVLMCVLAGAEKRRLAEVLLSQEDCKRARVIGDIPMELINDVMATITDPSAMLGPEVDIHTHAHTHTQSHEYTSLPLLGHYYYYYV